MINIERQSVQILEADKRTPVCDLAKYQEVHSKDAGEPLSSVDFRLYRIALQEDGGLPAVDAKKQVKTVREMYYSGSRDEKNRIAGVVASTFEGLTRRRDLQPIPVLVPITENVIFRSNR
jgi:hypothetical protein